MYNTSVILICVITTSSILADSSSKCEEVKIQACKVNLDGVQGPPGERGIPGPVGPPGRKGIPHACWCRQPKQSVGDRIANDDDGTRLRPFKSCSVATVDKNSGNYYIGTYSSPFQVYCNFEISRTCLIIKQSEEVQRDNEFIKHENRPFWLSKKTEFNLTKFYGYSLSQMEQLWQESSSVLQRIRYHCKNSQVLPDDKENSLLMLTWKDTVIGPKPTDRNPLHYNVLNDGCKDSYTEWKYTDIEILSTNKNLPVVDFHIRDIRKEDQMFYLELLELCFI